jgi:hypothetical protein
MNIWKLTLKKRSRRRPRKREEGNIEMSRRKIENKCEKWMNWIGILYNRGFNCWPFYYIWIQMRLIIETMHTFVHLQLSKAVP